MTIDLDELRSKENDNKNNIEEFRIAKRLEYKNNSELVFIYNSDYLKRIMTDDKLLDVLIRNDVILASEIRQLLGLE